MSIALSRINICKNIKIWNFHLYRTLHDSSLKLFFTVIHHLCNSLNSLLLKKLIWARITNPHHSLFSSGFCQSDWGFLYDQPPLVLETFPLVTDGLVETYFVPGPLGLWHQEVSSCYGDPCHWNPLKIKLKDGSCTQTCAPNKDFFLFPLFSFPSLTIHSNANILQTLLLTRSHRIHLPSMALLICCTLSLKKSVSHKHLLLDLCQQHSQALLSRPLPLS